MGRTAIIVAGGSGVRMGAVVAKQFLPLGGEPIIMRTVERFRGLVDRIVVVVPADSPMLDWGPDVVVCPGGATRFESVRNAVAMLGVGATNACLQGRAVASPKSAADPGANGHCQSTILRTSVSPRLGGSPRDSVECAQDNVSDGICDINSLVAIHDGVRPLVSRELIARAFDEAERHGSAVPFVRPADSFRLDGKVIDRAGLMSIQTPQVFRMEWLGEACSCPEGGAFTDDASLVETLGHKLNFIEGETTNIKITTPADLIIAEALWKNDSHTGSTAPHGGSRG